MGFSNFKTEIEVAKRFNLRTDSKPFVKTNLWVPAVNNVGEFGRWAVCEVTDPFEVKQTILEFLEK